MPRPLHFVIPFASALPPGCENMTRQLALPHLQALLAGCEALPADEGNEYALSPPHERAHAAAWRWQGADGALPLAAHLAALDGIDTGDLAWGLLTPSHWHVGRDQITLLDPDLLALEEIESRSLLESVRELFESEGFALVYGAAQRWYAAHGSLADLPCAALDRAIGRNVDPWLPAGPQARLIRRLQNEVQMLLYRHPLNDARQAQGQLPVNSLWLSGCGRRQVCADVQVRVLGDLRAPALQSDWTAWGQAWRDLDAGALADLRACAQDAPWTLSLCGERSTQSFRSTGTRRWLRWARHGWQRWRQRPVHSLLGTL